MQANITTKIVEHGGEMKSEKTYRALADSLKRATKQLQSLERSLNRLIKQIDRINDDDYPVGIISMTDINNRIVAEGKNPADLKAKDIMSAPVDVADYENDIGYFSKIMM